MKFKHILIFCLSSFVVAQEDAPTEVATPEESEDDRRERIQK
jgi:hypothetical protein